MIPHSAVARTAARAREPRRPAPAPAPARWAAIRASRRSALCGARASWVGARQSAASSRQNGGTAWSMRSGARPWPYSWTAAPRAMGVAPGNGDAPDANTSWMTMPSAQTSADGRTRTPSSPSGARQRSGGK